MEAGAIRITRHAVNRYAMRVLNDPLTPGGKIRSLIRKHIRESVEAPRHVHRKARLYLAPDVGFLWHAETRLVFVVGLGGSGLDVLTVIRVQSKCKAKRYREGWIW